ncbi:MAG: hypothetical protein JO078_02110 [Candidatus Eremiobacteraeota bacterium]|nr:hypothetical protein [Candidatus Eremiobacteraeota bacterium]MBV9055114.1 hypothetical protein [Candidatus Eremiobacteraeota bacterium]MBV9698897.1 hypothetical protein [Candidatus Eremiobacteraeota bacterium]
MRGRCIALAWLLGLAVAPSRHTAAMTLDRCTVVAVQMMENVSSEDARPGDFFRFETINAVTAGANVVIPARTMGEGVVAVASPAGTHDARPGVLVLEPRYLVLPDGRHLGVILNHNTDGLERSGANAGIPGYLGAIPVPGVGAAIGIFNYFRKGKNIEVRRGTMFSVFPSDDPAVERCQDQPAY